MEYVSSEEFATGEQVGIGQSMRVLRAEYDPSIVVKSRVNGVPMTVVYENKDGLRFYIYGCSLEETQKFSTLKHSYARARDLKHALQPV